MLRSIKYCGRVLCKLKSKGIRATSLSAYDFLTLNITLPHNLIKEQLIGLIERAFKKICKTKVCFILLFNDKQVFFISIGHSVVNFRSCQELEQPKGKFRS